MTPREIVEKFLRSLEARDLPTAQALLAPGMIMTFPGNRKFTRMEDLIASSKNRYRNVRKTFQKWDEFKVGDVTVVYSCGLLNGEWPDGSALKDIRYIDRFEIKDGKIVDQQVWNDLAEFRPT
ncbi:MAG: nuclear transport factor 2 family protein [Alphaproteobacteria bacterium]|nr:nuclear transport factor 2 family protein [Alphaproteobacteria bacterium]